MVANDSWPLSANGLLHSTSSSQILRGKIYCIAPPAAVLTWPRCHVVINQEYFAGGTGYTGRTFKNLWNGNRAFFSHGITELPRIPFEHQRSQEKIPTRSQGMALRIAANADSPFLNQIFGLKNPRWKGVIFSDDFWPKYQLFVLCYQTNDDIKRKLGVAISLFAFIIAKSTI